MLRAMRLPERTELSILLCGDSEMQRLNLEYRGLDRPTDVLAFALNEGESPQLAPHVLGDVVVSIDTARRQAARQKRSLISEVTHLLAHGLLHLLGFDHRDRDEERRMVARTDLLVSAATGAQGR